MEEEEGEAIMLKFINLILEDGTYFFKNTSVLWIIHYLYNNTCKNFHYTTFFQSMCDFIILWWLLKFYWSSPFHAILVFRCLRLRPHVPTFHRFRSDESEESRMKKIIARLFTQLYRFTKRIFKSVKTVEKSERMECGRSLKITWVWKIWKNKKTN